MSMYALLRNNPTPSEEELETAFEGMGKKHLLLLPSAPSSFLRGPICQATFAVAPATDLLWKVTKRSQRYTQVLHLFTIFMT